MPDIEQRSEEWFAARAGKITASRMPEVLAERERGEFKSGPRKGQAKPQPKALTDYAYQLAAERLTGLPRKQVRASALTWGREVEPAALAAYQAETGVIVEPCGFYLHPEYDFIGASPDFLIGSAGGGEIKSPESTEIHLETLLTGLPAEHIGQIQAGLWVTGRSYWDFVSYHPSFAERHRLYIQRIERDDQYISGMLEACLLMEADVQNILNELERKAA